MRSVNIARMFEKQENLDELATLLKREAGESRRSCCRRYSV